MPSDQQFGAGAGMNGQAQGGIPQKPEEPSLLTAEEQEALKPKEVTVENPWIYE